MEYVIISLLAALTLVLVLVLVLTLRMLSFADLVMEALNVQNENQEAQADYLIKLAEVIKQGADNNTVLIREQGSSFASVSAGLLQMFPRKERTKIEGIMLRAGEQSRRVFEEARTGVEPEVDMSAYVAANDDTSKTTLQ